jgi:hypothetical protein
MFHFPLGYLSVFSIKGVLHSCGSALRVTCLCICAIQLKELIIFEVSFYFGGIFCFVEIIISAISFFILKMFRTVSSLFISVKSFVLVIFFFLIFTTWGLNTRSIVNEYMNRNTVLWCSYTNYWIRSIIKVLFFVFIYELVSEVYLKKTPIFRLRFI